MRPQHADYSPMREAWAAADEMGVDTLWTWDHFFPTFGDLDGKHFEGWSLLAAMAEVTSRAEIGVLVSCNSYRNPQLLADMARTVDHISGGRVILGIGAGWFERDYVEYGYEFGTVGGRLRDFEAALPLMESRLEKLNPPPTRKIPLMIGGGGEKVTLRITAQHADIWNGAGWDVEVYRHKNQVLTDWCEKVGRDPTDIERSAILSSALDGSGPLSGPQRVEEVTRLVAAGARHPILPTAGPDYDLAPLRHLLEWRDSQNSRVETARY